MHRKSIPPQNKFPLLTVFQDGFVRPIQGMTSLVNRYTGKILDGMDARPPVLWDAQKVHDYMPDETTYAKLNLYDIPSVPPFSTTWLEWNQSKQKDHFEQVRRSVLVNRTGSADDEFEFIVMTGSDQYQRPGLPYPILSPVVGIARFNPDGILVEGSTRFGHPEHPPGIPDDVWESLEEVVESAIATCLVAFMFSHCKNVELVERLPRRYEQRSASRNGKMILKYHEVIITPDRKAYKDIDPASPSRHDDRPKKAMHIARGHFAHYTEDKPLFGKYTGTFWRPAHVRGSADAGTVYKDYKVKV